MSRSITIRLRVTPEERDELERRAGGAGRVSAWLRELALGEAVAPDGRAEGAAKRWRKAHPGRCPVCGDTGIDERFAVSPDPRLLRPQVCHLCGTDSRKVAK